MAAMVVGAIEQEPMDAGLAHVAEGDLLRLKHRPAPELDALRSPYARQPRRVRSTGVA
jgi:hypothetical protein